MSVRDVMILVALFIATVFCLFTISLARENGRLRERIALHTILLTGPTACRITSIIPTPLPEENVYVLVCKKEDVSP